MLDTFSSFSLNLAACDMQRWKSSITGTRAIQTPMSHLLRPSSRWRKIAILVLYWPRRSASTFRWMALYWNQSAVKVKSFDPKASWKRWMMLQGCFLVSFPPTVVIWCWHGWILPEAAAVCYVSRRVWCAHNIHNMYLVCTSNPLSFFRQFWWYR